VIAATTDSEKEEREKKKGEGVCERKEERRWNRPEKLKCNSH